MAGKIERPGRDHDQGLRDFHARGSFLNNAAILIALLALVLGIILSLGEGNNCNGEGCGGEGGNVKPRVLIVASRNSNLW